MSDIGYPTTDKWLPKEEWAEQKLEAGLRLLAGDVDRENIKEIKKQADSLSYLLWHGYEPCCIRPFGKDSLPRAEVLCGVFLLHGFKIDREFLDEVIIRYVLFRLPHQSPLTGLEVLRLRRKLEDFLKIAVDVLLDRPLGEYKSVEVFSVQERLAEIQHWIKRANNIKGTCTPT